MKRLFATLLALLTVFSCIGCSKTEPAKSNTTNITGTENNGNELNNKTDDETVSTEPTVANQYDENAVLFVCSDRMDIEGDGSFLYFYNYKGDLLKTEEHPNIGFYSKNGLAPAGDPATGLVGFVDLRGVFVIEPKWSDAAAFSDDNIALVAIEDEEYKVKYGYINETGEEVVPCIYDDATSFYPSGMAIIGFSEESIKSEEYEGELYTYTDYSYKYGVIDKKGKTIIEPQYDRIEHIVGEYIICWNEGVVDFYNQLGVKLSSEKADFENYTYRNTEEGFLRTSQHYIDGYQQALFNGKTFENLEDVSDIRIEVRNVATTSTGYAQGVVRGEDTVIPFEYNEIIEYNSFYVAIKYKNEKKSNQVFDIYNENFEKTAEGIEHNFSLNRRDPVGSTCNLPSGYFEVWGYYEETGIQYKGIVDFTGKIIVPPLMDSRITLYTYEGAGGKFPRLI